MESRRGASSDWLTARPIAHRGLHDAAGGVVENTLEAARAAVAAGWAIECDLQRTQDGEAVVFHDRTLERLTDATGRLGAMTLAQLRQLSLKGSESRIASLAQLLKTVAGRVPVVCEIKSEFNGDMRLAERAVEITESYAGPLAFKSFDPAVVACLHRVARAQRPLGVVAQACFEPAEWPDLSGEARHALANFLHYEESRPHFVSFRAADLPHAVPFLCRRGLRLPVLAWTLRSAVAAAAARSHCDQVVFEGFAPAARD